MAGSITAYETKAGTRYRVRYRKPNGAQTDKRGFKTKRDARQYLADVSVKKSEGAYVDPSKGKILVYDLGQRWLEGQTHLKPSTMKAIDSAWRIHVQPKWGDWAVSKIDHSEIQDWVTHLHKGGKKTRSATTVMRAHGILSAILDRAVRDNRIPANPAKGINMPRKKPKERAYLTHKQVELLAKESKTFKALVFTLAYTGLRWGEATGLQVSDVDFIRKRLNIKRNAVLVGGVVHVGTPKTHRQRWTPFPEFLRPLLTECAKDKERTEWLFGDGKTTVLLPSSQRGWFDMAVKRCQKIDRTFPRVTPHDLRHTTASLAISAGANVKAVQRMLGHASAAMTLDTYADLFDDDLETVATALNHARLASG